MAECDDLARVVMEGIWKNNLTHANYQVATTVCEKQALMGIPEAQYHLGGLYTVHLGRIYPNESETSSIRVIEWSTFMKKKMSRWGIGPIFASLSIGYGMIMLAISRYYHPVFQIDFLPYLFISILGISLIIIGLPFFITSVKTVMQAYDADELVTDGIFRCCRHPLYASWVVFIVPGIVLLVNSWVGLTTPIFMYLILRKLVIKEERYLESVFGSDYLLYKRKVPRILPYGFMKLSV